MGPGRVAIVEYAPVRQIDPRNRTKLHGCLPTCSLSPPTYGMFAKHD